MILISVIITLTLSVNKKQQNVSKQSLIHWLNWNLWLNCYPSLC